MLVCVLLLLLSIVVGTVVVLFKVDVAVVVGMSFVGCGDIILLLDVVVNVIVMVLEVEYVNNE